MENEKWQMANVKYLPFAISHLSFSILLLKRSPRSKEKQKNWLLANGKWRFVI
jgi:hypothetical protein